MIIAISVLAALVAIAVATVPVLVGMHLHHHDEPWTAAVTTSDGIVAQQSDVAAIRRHSRQVRHTPSHSLTSHRRESIR